MDQEHISYGQPVIIITVSQNDYSYPYTPGDSSALSGGTVTAIAIPVVVVTSLILLVVVVMVVAIVVAVLRKKSKTKQVERYT